MPRFHRFFSPVHWLHGGLEKLHIIRFQIDCPKEEHYPRSWIILEEARRRGLIVEHLHILGRPSTEYRVRFESRRFYFDILPTRKIHDQLDDKAFVKKQLKRAGFPVPDGRAFWSRRGGISYARGLGLPVVTKPTNGTRSQHVTAPVKTEEMLAEAIRRAARYGGRFIVEQYLPGELYRITVVNQNHVFAVHRLAPHVIGNGTATIRELIEQKNTDPRRGGTNAKHTTLHQMIVNTQTETILAEQGFTLDTIPPVSQWVTLYHKRSCGAGGDLIERTPELHPETKEMFRHAARLFGVDLVGFDFIAEDLTRSYRDQRCGIIEANSLPFIDFHVHPTHGAPQPIAEILWESVLADPRAQLLHPSQKLSRAGIVMNTLLLFWVPATRRALETFRLVRNNRQPFLIGKLKDEVTAERVITHLKYTGFDHTALAWQDHGQIASLRKLIDQERQCHIRIFNDGEVRGHIEYAPETRPIAHLLERHFVPLAAELLEPLLAFIARDH